MADSAASVLTGFEVTARNGVLWGLAGFAVFHGFAHGVEAPADGSFWLYGAGFAVATAALHAAGFTLNQHLTSTARRVGSARAWKMSFNRSLYCSIRLSISERNT